MRKVANRDVARFAKQEVQVEGYGATYSMNGFWTIGHLPRNLHKLIIDNSVDFVIYSYSTPIAWRDRGIWVRPAVSYSVTTSKHQGYLWVLDTVEIPYDISKDEYERVIAGKMRYVSDWSRRTPGRFIPGPNFDATKNRK